MNENNQTKNPFLLLALGNDLLGDDGLAFAAARQLKEKLCNSPVDIMESSEAGLALIELMTGYKKALLLDSVQTQQCPAGTILEFGIKDFRKIVAPSPHYAGIPEVLEMAKKLNIPFPKEIRILAVEVVNPFEFREDFSPEVEKALPEFIKKAKKILEGFYA